MSDLPERIWLTKPSPDEIEWTSEKRDDADTPYLRADLAGEQAGAPYLGMTCKSAFVPLDHRLKSLTGTLILSSPRKSKRKSTMDKCREEFEKWAKGYVHTQRVYKMEGNTVLDELEDNYPRLDTQLAWMAFQSAWDASTLAVGYSEEQMKVAYDEGLRFGVQEDMGSDDGEQANSLAELLATLTPAQPYGADGVGLSHADVTSLIIGEKPREKCVWQEDGEFIWNTECKNSFTLLFVPECGTPVENGFIYCTYCGKPLVQRSYQPEESED